MLPDEIVFINEAARATFADMEIRSNDLPLNLTGQTRLPGFKGKWEERSLSQVAAIRSGGTPSTNDPPY